MKSVVTISRKWNNPRIETAITEESISLQISMDDFIAALKQEIGKVTWVFTQKEFDKRLDAAILSVFQGIKDESTKVV